MPWILAPSFPSSPSWTRIIKKNDPRLQVSTSGAMPPNMIGAPADGWEGGDDKPVLYICASNSTRTQAILDHIRISVPDVHRRARVIEFTDAHEFEEHALRTVVADDDMYSGICVWLDSQNVAQYFGVMCRLALAFFPSHIPQDELQVREMRIMVTRLLTFADVAGVPLFIHQQEKAWNDFLTLREKHTETADEIKNIHTSKWAEFSFNKKHSDGNIRMRLGMTDPIDE